jgi:hypothetical protein
MPHKHFYLDFSPFSRSSYVIDISFMKLQKLTLFPQGLCFALLRLFFALPNVSNNAPLSEPSVSHGKSMLLLFDTACFLLCETLRNLNPIDLFITISLPIHNHTVTAVC